MKRAKAVAIVGAPCSGKSTLASQTNSLLKTKGLNSVFIEEYVVEYIAEYGIPDTMEQQMVIFDEQHRKERMFADSRDFVICDSASFLSYIYGRRYFDNPLSNRALASLSHLHKKVLKSLEYWDYIFYIPLLEQHVMDGVRYDDREASEKLDRMIKGFLELERIPYIDLSNVALEDRIKIVEQTLTNKEEV
jgi:nicotinamide riboside kinase